MLTVTKLYFYTLVRWYVFLMFGVCVCVLYMHEYESACHQSTWNRYSLGQLFALTEGFLVLGSAFGSPTKQGSIWALKK